MSTDRVPDISATLADLMLYGSTGRVQGGGCLAQRDEEVLVQNTCASFHLHVLLPEADRRKVSWKHGTKVFIPLATDRTNCFSEDPVMGRMHVGRPWW